ncbi:unnamed protein product [Cuscuta campestris]|uniref:Cytokinin riboside 5'-monophosphate phosphoribohydrolase n=1 Tax=Cuscuta campestris TaxID=132261 RepID=A0A484NJ92_9ASTE|nr:unnamed protein product [Cuscuta campestris]
MLVTKLFAEGAVQRSIFIPTIGLPNNELMVKRDWKSMRIPKFMTTAVDFGRELIRRRISLAYGGGNVGLQGAVASRVFTNGGLIRGFIPGYIATRRVYGPTYGVEHTLSSNYYKYFEMNHAMEAFIVLPGGVDTMENDAVRQNFMSLSQRKLFISSFFVGELLDKLEFAIAFPGPGAFFLEAKAFASERDGKIGLNSCRGESEGFRLTLSPNNSLSTLHGDMPVLPLPEGAFPVGRWCWFRA